LQPVVYDVSKIVIVVWYLLVNVITNDEIVQEYGKSLSSLLHSLLYSSDTVSPYGVFLKIKMMLQ
jgi:hypothetical protein